MRYMILISSIVILLAILGSQIYFPGPILHGGIEVAEPIILAVIIPGIIFSALAAIIGIRAINLYGGKLGDGLEWISAGFIFITGIILVEVPRYAGLVPLKAFDNALASGMLALGMVFIIIGLRKIIRVTK